MKILVTGLSILWGLSLGWVALAADFNADGKDDLAIFRPSEGRWSVRGITSVYLGQGGDIPAPVDLAGDGTDRPAVFRPGEGLWAVHRTTRVYFGSEGDVPIGKGGYNPASPSCDYVVRPNDGADLERALESDVYVSVFVPAGDYTVYDPITVDNVKQITGEAANAVQIYFSGTAYLAIASAGCTVEKLTVNNGGFTNIGNVFIGTGGVTVRDCHSRYSSYDGFLYTSGASGVKMVECTSSYAALAGFNGDSSVSNACLIGCSSIDTGTITGADNGFEDCANLVGCYVNGEYCGFKGCVNLSSCIAQDCTYYGFTHCRGLSACQVYGGGTTLYGIDGSSHISSTHVQGTAVNPYNGCSLVDAGSCD
jgi:hypothetical protein